MALKIRLRQQGRTNRPFYRLVVTDARSPRDGKYIEMLGWYNPMAEGDLSCKVEADRLQHWLDHGAQLSENVKAILRGYVPVILQGEKKKLAARKSKTADAKRRYRKRLAEKRAAA